MATDWRRAVADVGPLVGFRMGTLRSRSRRRVGVACAVLVLLTLACAFLPATFDGAGSSPRAGDLLAVLPSVLAVFLLTTTLATALAGGGRELLPADTAVAFPVSPATDHLGALLMAPLNLTWLVQVWSVVGVTAYAVGPAGLVRAQLTVAAWLLAATATAQLAAWGVEWVRRGPRGRLLVRGVGTALALGAAVLVGSGGLEAVLAEGPTAAVTKLALLGGAGAPGASWLLGTAVLVLAAALATVLGGVAARAVARRPAAEQHRAEARSVAVRAMPRSDMAALVRVDRAAVWRSVPLRRGLLTLALLPTAVTASGAMSWQQLPALAGVVLAGGALLYGVNAWCLDGRGALWKTSLPASARVVFVARARVLLEGLCLVAVLPLLVAALRLGALPSAAEAVSLVATVAVVALQVVARVLHWSVRRPYAVDLGSSRGAPAPPVAMVHYSAHLSLSATVTASLFMFTAQAGSVAPALVVAAPLTALALRRLRLTASEWAEPAVRARVAGTVAA